MEDKEQKFNDLFKQKFEDFESEPDHRLRDRILLKAQEKKRRVIPFWLPLGSAAGLLLALFSWLWMKDREDKLRSVITDNQTITTKPTNQKEAERQQTETDKNQFAARPTPAKKSTTFAKKLPMNGVGNDVARKKEVVDKSQQINPALEQKPIETRVELASTNEVQNLNLIAENSLALNEDSRIQFAGVETKNLPVKWLKTSKLQPEISRPLLPLFEEAVVAETKNQFRLKKNSWGVYPILGYRSTLPNKQDAFYVKEVAQQNLFQRLGIKAEGNRQFFENKYFEISSNLQAGTFRQSFDFQVLNLNAEHKSVVTDGSISHYQTSFDKHGFKEDFWSSFVSLGITATHKIKGSERHKVYGATRGLAARHASNISGSPAFDLGYTYSIQRPGYQVVVQPQLSYLALPLNVPIDYFSVKNYQVGLGIVFEPK